VNRKWGAVGRIPSAYWGDDPGFTFGNGDAGKPQSCAFYSRELKRDGEKGGRSSEASTGSSQLLTHTASEKIHRRNHVGISPMRPGEGGGILRETGTRRDGANFVGGESANSGKRT